MSEVDNKSDSFASDVAVANLDQEGVSYAVVLPQAGRDHIQKHIFDTGMPYELAMLQDMRQRLVPDDLVLDVGANIGNHALYLAAVARARVIAFEPNRALCAAMTDSVRRSGLEERVSVRPIGLGSVTAMARFVRETPENIGTQELALGAGDIEVVPLDSLEIAGRIAAIKIDVEGMELQVIEGAATRISRDRPILYVECQDEGAFRQVAAWAEMRNYTCWDVFNATPTQLFLPAETVSVERRIAQLTTQAMRQDYRLGGQLRAGRREKNAALAEASRLRAALDKTRNEIDGLRARVASGAERITALELENSEIEKRAADQRIAAEAREALQAAEREKSQGQQRAAERQASTARAEVARVKAEFADLRRYARGLEKKYADILASETWRAMEPVRRVLRGIKRRPPPASFTPRLTGKVIAPARTDMAAEIQKGDAAAALIGADPRIVRGEKVVVFLTTFPGRAGNLPKIVDALLPQCDTLAVYLNEYDAVPACLASPKVRAILGRDAAGNLKDNGKFFATADYPNSYHIFVDDDIFYPPDYVAAVVRGIRRFGFRAIVGFHGTIYEPPLESYIRDRTVLPFFAASRDTLVDQLGTGTTGCHASTFSTDLSAFETAGMADLWFAKRAAEAGIPMVTLKRPAKWLVGMDEIDDTLFRQVQRDESRETALLRERLAPALRQGPRMEMLGFIRSLYAQAYLDGRLDTATSAGGAFGGPA